MSWRIRLKALKQVPLESNLHFETYAGFHCDEDA
jgi:hypothetical protein